jgi:SAM-dependent methyltransferase
MLPKHVTSHLAEVEQNCPEADRSAALRGLRPLGLGDFVQVLARMPIPDYPRLSSCLPAMAPDDVTRRWTGGDPVQVMNLAVDFARTCAERYTALTGRTLQDRRILDFGCGYGRILRVFSFFSDAVVGVDAWPTSLDQCRRVGLGDTVFQSEELPDRLPVEGGFDFLTAFSVFTHLSLEATRRSLAALRGSANPDALLAITIRPVEYWDFAVAGPLRARADEARGMPEVHERDGFAFLPHPGREHYGDTSLTIPWLQSVAAGWTVAGMDRSATDSLQRYVFLKAV